MAEYTENYNLKKPAQEDFYNVEDFNNNADVIDKELKAVSDKAAAALPATSYTAADILNKLKTVDGNGSGLDADLFKGQSVIPIANGGTGATNLDKFLSVRSIPEEVNILLDLLTTGIYGVYQGNTKFTDWPAEIGNTNVYGILEVQKNGVYVTQRLILTNGNTVGTEIWVRFINSSSMRTTSWNEVVTSENLTSLIQSALENGGVSVVKSIQRGVMTIEAENTQATATISEVNPNKSLVIYTGCVTGNNINHLPMLVLTANDTVTATRLGSGDNYGTSVPYQVIEFY